MRFTKNIDTEEQYNDWKITWTIGLEGLTLKQIEYAMMECIKSHDWPPGPSEFRKIVDKEEKIDYEGMFKNAANAISTKNWPDALTYHSACAFGIFELRSATLSNTNMTRWKEIVERLKDHNLEMPVYNEDQLPAPGQTHNSEVALTHLEQLKKMLNGRKEHEELGEIPEIASGCRLDDVATKSDE